MAEFNQMDEWIVDDLVESIQENHTIWRETFERDENVNSLPRSGVTGQVFKTNLEGFARLQRQYDFTDPRWMTRAELMSLGWDITDDARGVVVGRDNYDKDIVVFNVSQAQPQRGFENSIKPWNPEIKEKQWFNVARADFILNASGANIKYGFKNSQYNTVSDNICLPYQSNFRSADDYYWTAFHELMHWTGSNSRLARNTSGNKNSPLYAREELVAELGAYMMCLRTGVSFDKSNASAYIKGWAENMQLDSASLKKELTLAWSEARRACDFVSRNVLMNMKKNNMKLDNSGRVYLNVDKDDVKDVISLGARYDTRQYAFYITPEHSFAKFNKYLDEAHRVSDISVSLVTKTENEYEREDDKAEEIRRGIEAEANAPPVEVPNLNSNLARYIAYSAIKGEHQLNSFYGDDLSSIISEIHDTSYYVDSSHFAHDVTDSVKNQIVASIAKNSNYSESEVYEQWDKDVNAYIRNARSIFVQMDKALFSLKYNLKNSFEDDVNHIRMLDEAYHDDAFLALINPKVENTVTEEAEQVAEVSENSEFVQKNENEAEQSNTEISEEQPELSITDFIKKYEAQFNKVIDLVENNIAYQNAVRNSDRANADMEFSKAFKESETQVLIENTHQYADFHNDLFDNDRYAEVEDYLFKQSYQKLIDRNQAKHLNNDEKTTIARYIAYKEVRNTSFGHELIQDGSLGKVLSDVEWKENDNLSVLAAKVAISTKKHAIEGMSRAWNMTLEDTQSAVSKVSSGGFDSHKLAIERMNEGVKQIITNITHSYGMADFDQLLNEARSDVRFNEQLSANLEPVQNENAEFVQKNENEEAEQNEMSDALAELISQNPDVVASPEELLERHFQEGYQKLGYYQNIDFETFKKINDVLPKENDESASESFAKWEHQDEEWCRADVINYISKNNDVLNFVLEKGQMPPLVFMHWSESNNVGQAFDETDRAGGFLPFAEADRVITEEDEAYAKENRGYEKTKLSLLFLNKSTTGEIEDLSYGRFRYDCGDLDGGIVKHIESWCDWCEEHKYGEWESLRDYKNQCLPILGKLNEQFEEFRLNQSQEQKQSNDLNWKIQWWGTEPENENETQWRLELVCDGKVISSASVSEDITEKRLHRLINNFSEELLDYFDLPEEQLEGLTQQVEDRVNGFMLSIKNVVELGELGHENQETAQTTVENNANNNYTNTNTSVLVESKENLDHEISSGMGGESRSSSTRTADEGLGADARNGQSSEVGEGSDHRTEGRAGTNGTDDGRSGRSGVLSDDAQNVSGGIGSGSSGREQSGIRQSGLRGRGSDLGERDDASTHQSHEGEQTGELSSGESRGTVVSRTSELSEGLSPEHQGIQSRADRREEGRDRVGDSVSSGGDQSGIGSASRRTESETSRESANGIGNEADGRSSGRLRRNSDGYGEADKGTGVLAQGGSGLGVRELSSGERVSSSMGGAVQVEVSAGVVQSRGDFQENETRRESDESVRSGVRRRMGNGETVVLGDDQGLSGRVLNGLGSGDQRTGGSGEEGDSERAEMESSVRSESDPQSTVNQSELSERAEGRGQPDGLDNQLSARSGASGEDSGRTESQGRSQSGISSGSRRKRSERDGEGKYDLDFGDLSNHVVDPEETVSNDTVIDVSEILGNENEAEQNNTVSSENSVPSVPATRYHITDYDIGAGSDKTRLANNMEALRTLKLLEKENRNATPEEQEKLAKYVGWGGLSNVFNPSRHEYEDARKELKTLLTNREYNDARASTVTAFYTPPEVIQSIYRGLEKAGFKGGRILEPSCGVGNFFGMLPESMSNS